MLAKIVDLATLAAKAAACRQQQQTVVQCHGIFDLLHIGHIRHFQQAKARGDVLVVTVTPDRFVNKGPHRPVFNEQFRCEAIAALDMVDYVALIETPTAVEAIAQIQPQVYAKGSDTRSKELPTLNEELQAEEAAVRRVGGTLWYTDDIAFSSSFLINRYTDVFAKEVSEYLMDFSSRYQMADVLKYLDGAKQLRVLVIGETIIDEYQYTQAIGKSSKEPTLVVKYLSQEKFAGGILAVANHVASFAGQVDMLTILGTQNSHEDFIREHLAPSVTPIFLYRPNSPTIIKRRFIEHYFFSKMFEVYEINDTPLDDATNQALCSTLERILPDYDLVIVTDFGHSMMSREAIEIVSRRAPFLALNVQSNAGNMGYHTVSVYPRADYVSISENEIRLEARDRQRSAREIMLETCQKMGIRYFTVTRGKAGSINYSADEGFYELPALAGRVVDRVGAGDALLSVTSLCVVQGAPMELTGFIGNTVGALAVATVGNREAVSYDKLVRYVETLLK